MSHAMSERVTILRVTSSDGTSCVRLCLILVRFLKPFNAATSQP